MSPRWKRQPHRPVGECPGCGRTIACTFDARTGAPYLRPHVAKPGERCPKSGLAPRESKTWLPSAPNPFRGDLLS